MNIIKEIKYIMVKVKEKSEWIDKVIKRKLLVNQKGVKWKEIKVNREKRNNILWWK